MWIKIGRFILNYRIPLFLLVAFATLFMAYHAQKVQLSYEFSKAIPTDHPKYKAYQDFKTQFGEDGNLLVIGFQINQLFEQQLFNNYNSFTQNIRKSEGVEDVVAVTTAINLIKNQETEKLTSALIFRESEMSQSEIDSCKNVFLNLPFYKNLLYNPETKAWLTGIRINKELLQTSKRIDAVNAISELANAFGKNNNLEIHLSGLPLIRTVIAKRIADEMQWFLAASVFLSALILLIFFRSFSAMFLSLLVVFIGVTFSLGTMVLLGYKITLLTALIPPLIVVIGIPNCIYFLNKFHTSFNETGDKKQALITMIARMGIVTLFCNIAAAIGFAVFALTKSEILKEFGVVAGINIMILFFISLILIPGILSFLPKPKSRHTKYLDNPRLNRLLDRLELWSLNHRKTIYSFTIVIVVFGIAGMFRLKNEAFIVDDLPKTDKIYTDLKFFETHFSGVMPLEIIIDTKKKYGISRNRKNLLRIDSLSQYLSEQPTIGKPLNITEGLKFAKQAFFEGDSLQYTVLSEYDLPALQPYLNFKKDTAVQSNSFSRLVSSFMDDEKQKARISVNMADVGSYRLPLLLDSIQQRADELFDKNKYDIVLTGSSVTFVEGSRFIINGLKESVLWAFALISLCMLYLFRSGRILLCSLIPNIIPLIITAGVMGWMGVRIKPSTVLIFSVALGIAIDITIRFLINYKQELNKNNFEIKQTVIETIHGTGISILYTSSVLIVGFAIFCFSSFGGTQSLGWLTSLTLITATITNLVLLPALLISLSKPKKI